MAKSTEGLLDLAMKTNVEVGLKRRTFLAEAALGEHCIKGFWRFDRCHFEMRLFCGHILNPILQQFYFSSQPLRMKPFVVATRPGRFEVHALILLDKRWFVVDVELSVKAFQLALTYLHISFLRENQLTRQRFLSDIGCLSRCNFGLKLRNLPNFGRSDRISMIKNHKPFASNVLYITFQPTKFREWAWPIKPRVSQWPPCSRDAGQVQYLFQWFDSKIDETMNKWTYEFIFPQTSTKIPKRSFEAKEFSCLLAAAVCDGLPWSESSPWIQSSSGLA